MNGITFILANGITALEPLIHDPRLDDKLRKHVRYHLAINGRIDLGEKYVEEIVTEMMSEKKADDRKMSLLSSLTHPNMNNIPGYRENLIRCLNTTNKKGEPHNYVRAEIWRLIYVKFGQRMLVELTLPSDGDDLKDDCLLLQVKTGPIFNTLLKESLQKTPQSRGFCNELALQEFNRIVTRKEVNK